MNYGHSLLPPGLSAPGLPAPGLPVPSHSAPSHSAPSHSAPSHSAPSHSAPSHSAPSHSAPSHSAPSLPPPSLPTGVSVKADRNHHNHNNHNHNHNNHNHNHNDAMDNGGDRDELVFRINRRDMESVYQRPASNDSQDPCKRALCDLFCTMTEWKEKGDAPGAVKRQKRMSRQNWEDAYVMRTTGRHIPTKTKEKVIGASDAQSVCSGTLKAKDARASCRLCGKKAAIRCKQCNVSLCLGFFDDTSCWERFHCDRYLPAPPKIQKDSESRFAAEELRELNQNTTIV